MTTSPLRKSKAKATRPALTLTALCRAFIKLQNEADDESLRQSRAHKAVKAAMPKPDALIQFGASAKKDGITPPMNLRVSDCDTPHRAIWPFLIERVLYNAEHPNNVERIDTDTTITMRWPTTPPPLTAEQQALVSRLKERLALSIAYKALHEAKLADAGVGKGKLEKMWDDLAKLETQIAKRRAVTLADLTAKIAVYKDVIRRFEVADEESLAVSIVEDVARLIKSPATAATILQFPAGGRA